MAEEDILSKLKDLKIEKNQDINILLLGETGVGKSTFINSVANYFHFRTFKKAKKADQLLILIPTRFSVTDEHHRQVPISVGTTDNNEYLEVGAAATQNVKTYVFPIGGKNTRLRFIDTPGMGDPRGIEQDEINCENILLYLSQLNELHAICFLMKPTTTRITVAFEYCVKQILSRLEKSASRNIVFIFTNTRGSNYTPGDTFSCLEKIIAEIKAKPPHVEIPLKDNIFSVDNEAFRILAAMKNGMEFSEDIQQKFIESWNKSVKECWRFISYIIGDASRDALTPHQLVNTISINKARTVVIQLSQPLADISQLIDDNIRILERHKLNLKMENQSLDKLKNKLYIPIINLEVIQLTQPVTVCTSTKCAELIKVEEVQKWHYRQRCHDPCYLTNVTKEIVGDVNLQYCAAMNGRTCQKCTCDFSVHMHVYYLTKTVSDRVEDTAVKNSITKKEEALQESKRLIDQIDQRKTELEQERSVILKSTAQFAHFLQHNAISPFNDAYKAYIEYLISRENSLGTHGDRQVVHNLEELLRQYDEMKAAFDQSLLLNKKLGLNYVIPSTVTPQSIMKTIETLYSLKHNGKKIKEMLKKQKHSRDKEYDKNCEYIHPQSSSQSEKKSKKGEKTKSGKNIDDERKKSDNCKKGQNRETEHRKNDAFGSGQNQRQWRQPPPPYHAINHQQNQPKIKNTENGQNIVVKVELKQQPKRQNNQNQDRPFGNQNQYKYGEAQGAYYYPPQPPQGQYPPSPQGYYPPPPPGQYLSPPQGQYPPPLMPPPPGGYYYPPQGYGYGAPPHGHFQGPPPQGYNSQKSSGNQIKGKSGRGRSKCKSRYAKDKKSGNGKNERSSDSDSSN